MITDEEALAILTIDAINRLFQVEYCSPETCYPCHVLQELANRPDGPGSLVNILTYAPDDALALWGHGDIRAFLCTRWTHKADQ